MVTLSRHFEIAAQQLLSKSGDLVASISLAGQWDIEQTLERNNKGPEIMDACVHDLFQRQAQLQPDALAIRA